MIEVCFVEIRAVGEEGAAWAADLAALVGAYHQRSSFLFFPLRQAWAEGEAVYLAEGASAYERLRFLDGRHRRADAEAEVKIMAFPDALGFDPQQIEINLNPTPPRLEAHDPASGRRVALDEPRAASRLRNLALNLLAARLQRPAQPAQPALCLTQAPFELRDPRTGFAYTDASVLETGNLGEMSKAFLKAFDD
ncbi:hypothetical protein KKB55_01420 [Myxococcota bacterium]|nr:hypothetical protein [Myxococcota bacterium]MBU1896413.1 hypothetical protein [Myxococcota bacterium]